MGQWNGQGLVSIDLTSLKIPRTSGKQLCCFVLKSKWKGFKLDIMRNCALSLFRWTSLSWALSDVLVTVCSTPVATEHPKPVFWTRVWTLPGISWLLAGPLLCTDSLFSGPPCVGHELGVMNGSPVGPVMSTLT